MHAFRQNLLRSPDETEIGPASSSGSVWEALLLAATGKVEYCM